MFRVGVRTGGVRGRCVALACAFALALLTLWALTHQYHGFMRDGQLYAFQAMARVHPWLSTDIYLQNTNQDQYTVFSPLYAALIKMMGLKDAGMLLFVICTASFLVAAWFLARSLSTTDTAYFAVAFLIATVGYYGAYGVFQYSDPYLTARSLGEALVVIALACHFNGWRWLSLAIGVVALFVHPLMALPGALLLICQWLPVRITLVLAALGVFAVLAVAVIASVSTVAVSTAAVSPSATLPFLTVMDAQWLEVVRERSQFLFLEYWSWADWERTARPFVSLTLTALAVPDARIRKLCITGMIVAFSGLAIAAIGGSIGPAAILVQGQAWRWVWMTQFISVLLLAVTLIHLWRDGACGPLAASLLLMGWTCAAVDGLACVDAALILWLLRSRVPEIMARLSRWVAGAVAVAIAVWVMTKCGSLFHGPVPGSGREPWLIGRLRECFDLGILAPVFAWVAWYGLRKLSSVWTISVACMGLLAMVVCVLPDSMRQVDKFGTREDIREYDDWRSVIPLSSNVLMLPSGKAALFQWFTLERPSYLSVGQSAGVVFSRATAAEVVRRSAVLSPLEAPGWKILSQIRRGRVHAVPASSGTSESDSEKPLTADALVHLCGDPQLGFVIARQNVGFEPRQHRSAGVYKDWYLYDCRPIRSPAHSG